jgi:hypothetical protein
MRRAYASEKTILDFADQVDDEDDESAIYEIYRRVEMHHVTCDFIDCYCRDFYSISRKELASWVYKYE